MPAGANTGFLTLEYNFFDATNDLVVLQDGLPIYYSDLTNHAVITTNATNATILITNYVPTRVTVPFEGSSPTLTLMINTVTNANSNWVYTASIQPLIVGPVYIAGDFTAVNGVDAGRVARLDPNGALDETYAENLGLGANDTVYSIGLQSDGGLILGGSFFEVNSFPASGVARVNPDGMVDRDFAVGLGASDVVFSVRVDPEDRVYAGGAFTSFNLTRRLLLTRLLENGSVDTSFLDSAYNQYAGFPSADGTRPIGRINSISVAPSGDVLVGGSFRRVGGGDTRTAVRPRNNVAMLHGGATPGPGNVSFQQEIFGGDEDGGALSVLAERTGGALGAIDVVFFTFDGAAVDGVDYAGFPEGGIMTWDLASGQSIGSVETLATAIDLIDDDILEGDEDFGVQMVYPFGYFTLGGEYILPGAALGRPTETTAIILDNDVEGAIVYFSKPEYDFDENAGTVSIEVFRQGNTSPSVSVRYSAEDLPSEDGVSATVGEDYFPVSGTLLFSSGQTNRTFTVRLRDDEIVEPDESFVLRLSPASPGVELGTNATARVNIIDNDYAPGRASLSATNYSVLEGGAVTVTFRRTGGNVGVLRVNYATQDGDAMAPFDYQARSGTLVWNDQESAPRTITIPTQDNGLVDGDKTFSIVLSNPNPAGGLGLRTNAVITIVDDDTYGSFSFNAEQILADENGTNVIVNVIRRAGSSETASVQYATKDMTAIAGEDYQAVSGTLTFGVGETSKSFFVPLIDNNEQDGERRIGLELSAALPQGALLGPLTNSVIAIIDDESFNIPAGSPETDFALGEGANGAVHAIAVQADGRILIGGDFTVVNRQVRTHLARLNQDLSLDTQFGTKLNLDGSVRDIAVQQDGRVVIAGSFTEINSQPYNYVARMTIGGLMDSTFNAGAGADNPVFAVETFSTPETGIGILIGGTFTRFNAADRRGIAQLGVDGRVNLQFNPGTGVNGTVYDIARQRDGKILIAGEFISVNGEQRLNIARLNADGSVDSTFNPGLGADGSIRQMLLQYDDRIIIGGLFNSFSDVPRAGIARLNTDGTLDSSFDPGSGANGAVYALALQLDGKILAGGEFTEFDGVRQNRIVRLNQDGSLDTTANFGQGANGFVAALAVQQDRRVLLGGGFTRFDRLERNRVARVYGGSIRGVGELQFAQADFRVLENATNAVIIVRRTGGLSGAVSVDYRTEARTAEPNADYVDVSGTLTFAPGVNEQRFLVPLVDDNLAEPDEIVDLILSNASGGAGLTVQPIATLTIVSDDSVISFVEPVYTVNESAPGGVAVITVMREGELSLPASIGYSTVQGGTATAGSDYTPVSGTLNFAPGEAVQVFTVPILDDSQVEENETVSLELFPIDPNQPVGRVRAVLTIIDNDFAPGVLNLVEPSPAGEGSGSVAITVSRVSGRTGAVTVNYATVNGTATAGQDYLPASGTLVFLEGETSKTFAVTILQDDIVEGTEFFTVQLSNPTGGAALGNSVITVSIVDDDFGPGSVDTTFNIGGGASGPVYSMRLQPDGKILLAGDFTTFDGFSYPRLARLNPNGSPDLGFSIGGGLNGTALSVDMHPEGNIVVGGSFTAFGPVSRRYVGRFSTNGLPDVNLNHQAEENALVRTVAVQPDGKAIIGGDFTTPARGVARLNQDGSLDVSFDPDGGTDGNVYRVRLQNDGRVLVGGEFTRFGITSTRSLARLLPSGLLDSSFNIGTGVNGRVNAITLAPGGQILIGGNFTSVNGVGRTRVARLNANGSVDMVFSPEAGPNGPVYDIAIMLDKIYVVGDFSMVGSTPRNGIARFELDGTLDTSFDAGIGADGPVHAVRVQPDGQILIAGAFNTVGGFFSPGVARLNGDQTAPPGDSRIETAFVDGGDVVLTYATEPGRTYIIEGSSDLVTWQTIETAVASGASAEFRESASQPYRFYRIRGE